MTDRAGEDRRHLGRLRALMRTVISSRQRRMLRDAIDHVRRRPVE